VPKKLNKNGTNLTGTVLDMKTFMAALITGSIIVAVDRS
jgi:hypothetical protein